MKALFKNNKYARMGYAMIAVVCIVLGSLQKVTLVLDMSDMFNGLMIIPNLLAVLALSGIVSKYANSDEFR